MARGLMRWWVLIHAIQVRGVKWKTVRTFVLGVSRSTLVRLVIVTRDGLTYLLASPISKLGRI